MSEAIDLAHERDFRLGRLEVRPGLRELVRDDEPRVMQVLVALARSAGAILSRADLTEACWEGRVIGEDAINRVLSRLRRVAEGIGAGSFRVETITKVGYRLIVSEAQAPPPVEAPATQPPRRPRLSRRTLVGGGAVAVAALGAAAWWRLPRLRSGGPPSNHAAQLFQQAMNALGEGTRDGRKEAMGVLRQLVLEYPDYADGWGALALTYSMNGRLGVPAEAATQRELARSAAGKAQALDPGNPLAQAGMAVLLPMRSHWLERERALRSALRAHPRNSVLLQFLANSLIGVGRMKEAADLLTAARAQKPIAPDLYYRSIWGSWAAGRLEEADRLIAEARQVYPTHFAIWFAQVYVLMFSGRAATSITVIDDADNRPGGIPVAEFENVRLEAVALASNTPAAVDRAADVWQARARTGAGYAENAIHLLAALGRLDAVFAIAQAYFFGRGFVIPDIRFSREQATYTPAPERKTELLFLPMTKPMRADPRFARLVQELGLEDYWRKIGVVPDYRRT